MLFKAFTIIETLFVILIFSILVSFSIYNYLSFKEKSYVVADTMSYIKVCISDIQTYCINHPGKSFSQEIFSNCQPKKGLYGNVTLEVPNATCTLNGTLPLGYQIKAFSSVSDKFYSICKYTEGGIVCYITPAD